MSAIRHLEVIEEPSAFYVLAEMPNVNGDNIRVDSAHSYVIIRVIDSTLHRTIPLPAPIAMHRAESTYRNGVLEVRCPKVTREGKGRVVLATQSPDSFVVKPKDRQSS